MAPGEPGASEAWLVVIDPQLVFAAPESPWAAPAFASIVEPVRRLAARFDDRILVTRWIPGEHRPGAWADYFAAWPFADRPGDDPLFAVVPELAGVSRHPTVDAATFGKFPELARVTGPAPTLVLTGVATDCCVISTALAAADAGARVRVVSDACAGSTPQNQAAALQVMGLYAPQIEVVTADRVR